MTDSTSPAPPAAETAASARQPAPAIHVAMGVAIVIVGAVLLAQTGTDKPPVAATLIGIAALVLGVAQAFAGVVMALGQRGSGTQVATSAAVGGGGMLRSIANVWTIMGRELRAYFTSPIAVVIFVIFHFAAVVLTFSGIAVNVNFWERGYTDMEPFFQVLPWLLLFFVPALSMRLWAEERQVGSIELLLTLPMRAGEILVGKFLGAWVIVGFMLLLPALSFYGMLLRVGQPDTGQIAASFFGAMLMGGAYLALGSFLSSLTKDQIVAFILAVIFSGAIAAIGSEYAVQTLMGIGATERAWADGKMVVTESGIGPFLAMVAKKLSLAARFQSIGRGVLDLADLLYYVCFIGFFLYLNSVVLALKR